MGYMGGKLVSDALSLRPYYGELAREGRGATPKLRERDWLVLLYLCNKSIDPDSTVDLKQRKAEKETGKRPRVRAGEVQRPLSELVAEALGRNEQPVSHSSETMAIDSLRRLERHGLIERLSNSRHGDRLPVIRLNVKRLAEELAMHTYAIIPLSLDGEEQPQGGASDLAGNSWEDEITTT